MSGPIDEYLAELGRQLRVGQFAKRRILREVEAHLLDAAERCGEEDTVVAAFGPAEVVAARFDARRPRWAVVAALAALGAGALAAMLVVGEGSSLRRTVSVVGLHALNKVYDGTDRAKIDDGGVRLLGVANHDSVSVDTSGAHARFANSNVGPHPVFISGVRIVGRDAQKYVLAPARTRATIAAKNLTITATTADDKVYDGTTFAHLDVSGSSLSGVVSGEDGTTSFTVCIRGRVGFRARCAN